MIQSPSGSTSEISPLIIEQKTVDLRVTINFVEGLKFLTELGTQQFLAASILFPTHLSDSLSPLFKPNEKVKFDFSETYQISIYPQTINCLLSNPLEFFLYICSYDMRKQTQIANFIFNFDELIFNNSYSSSIEGKLLPEGQNVLSPEGIKLNIECTWLTPLFTQEECDNSMITTFNISSINMPPLAIINSTTQPNNYATHIFTYSLATQFPDGQVLVWENGRFVSNTPDASDASIQFNSIQKIFVSSEGVEKVKKEAEEEQTLKFYLRPEINALLQPLGIQQEQYGALFGVAEVPISNFIKPGRSHFPLTIPLLRDKQFEEHNFEAPSFTPNGFPPEQTDSRKKVSLRRGTSATKSKSNIFPSSSSNNITSNKKPKALTAKDKKILAQLQSILNFDPNTDYFEESTTQVKLEITFSKPLIPRPATPASTKTPEEIIKPLPKFHKDRLANATEEFCHQIKRAIERLTIAHNEGSNFDSLRTVIKEELKPSIVEIVKQVYHSKSDTDFKITDAFLSELRSFLIVNLNKTVNDRFHLTYPRPLPLPPAIDVYHITKRIESSFYFSLYDIESLYLRRCELEPLNSQWAFEVALYYNSIHSPKSLDYFAKSISINYNFPPSILGFCANLAKNDNKEDCIVLLNMLLERDPNDPTIIVCLSILYQLIESTKSDEYLAKVSHLSSQLSTSPYLIAARNLLSVNDTYLSEIMLVKEQLQNQRSKELLILLAKLTQLNKEYQRSQEYLKEALEIDCEDINIMKTIGKFYYESTDYNKAQTNFEQILAVSNKPDPEVCLMLSIIYIKKEYYEKAYNLLMYVVQNMEISIAWICLGICCLRNNDLNEAEASFTQANILDKWEPITWGYIALVCALEKRFVEGQQAVCLATRLKLRDFMLIGEIVEKYEKLELNETTNDCINELKEIIENDCHKSLEEKIN
ncbi:cilia- and flagella-associated protein [Histomonas meleagridis]|uniref:cilia- and flagella-associated protein 70 isoform X1 n=1 Tax=Histomonas meleagridis TaxID=135588 RepID=UPI00355A3F17|nr:cilia- and flagella-associated protein [Histomonas meleagridis]KAH0800611.1 cilia- and flagella-associated protein 70 isoform X1 [Histomonas meleagridis]